MAMFMVLHLGRSQNSACIRSAEVLAKTKTVRVSKAGEGLKTCISNELPGAAAATPWTQFQNLT